MVSGNVVVSVLIRILLHSMCILIRDFMLYEYELGHNTAVATKTFVVQKVKAQLITIL